MKELRVEVETLIDRPVEEVSAYAADPMNAPEWYANIKESQWVGEPGLREGAQAAFVAKFMGRRLEYTYEIREYRPAQRLVMATAQGPFPMETTYEWEAVGENATRMRLINRGRPAGFSRWLAPFMATAMRKATTKDLKNIKGILESNH